MSTRAVLSVALLAVAACSGAQANVAATNTRADDAHLAQQASDPRTNDPTSTQPGSAVPTPSTALNVGGSSAPTTPNSSPPVPSEPATTKTTSATELDAPKKISARHVLVQWMGSDRAGKSVLRTREQAMALAKEVLRRAKAGDDLGRLAVEYSDEPNAGARGGSLGRFSRGQMVPAFEQVAFKLKVGEISDIVETPFGFHIIQRTE